MFKFLFLSGPVMYLKHMGTPATICPRSHFQSTFLAVRHFDREHGEGEGGSGGWPMPTSAWQPLILAGGCRGSDSSWGCYLYHRSFVTIWGRSREWGDQVWVHAGESAWFWLLNRLFDFRFSFWFRELDMVLAKTWPMFMGSEKKQGCFSSPLGGFSWSS